MPVQIAVEDGQTEVFLCAVCTKPEPARAGLEKGISNADDLTILSDPV